MPEQVTLGGVTELTAGCCRGEEAASFQLLPCLPLFPSGPCWLNWMQSNFYRPYSLPVQPFNVALWSGQPMALPPLSLLGLPEQKPPQ